MTVRDLLIRRSSFNDAAIFIFINSKEELVSFSLKNPVSNKELENLEVLSFDFQSICDRAFLRSYYKKFESSALALSLVGAIERLPLDSMTLIIKFNETVGCFIVIERYYNDGSHKTGLKPVATDISNISESFDSDDECDTFIKPFPNVEEAELYLRSRFYLDIVKSRKRNRMAKVKNCQTENIRFL